MKELVEAITLIFVGHGTIMAALSLASYLAGDMEAHTRRLALAAYSFAVAANLRAS